MSFAKDQARRAGLQDVKVDALSVSGTKNGSLAIITCVGVVTVVMVSGDNGTDGGPLAKAAVYGNERRGLHRRMLMPATL